MTQIIPVFQRNTLLPSSVEKFLKTEATGCS